MKTPADLMAPSKRKPRLPPKDTARFLNKRRARKMRTFTLSERAIARLETLAAEYGEPLSRTLERLILGESAGK